MTTNLFQKIAFFGVALATLTSAWGQEGVTATDRFRLWNDCKPIGLYVWGADNHDNFDKNAVETAVRSRLRSARLYEKGSSPSAYLEVIVGIFGSDKDFSFSLGIQLKKTVTDESSGQYDYAATWRTGSVGWGDSNEIMSGVSENMDKFLDEYLRVNESACR